MNLNKEDEIFVQNALSWFFENGIINKPVLNTIYLNIFNFSTRIKDVEILVCENTKSMMIYIEFDWLCKLLKSYKKIIPDLLDELNKNLPQFRIRVVLERSLLEKAQEIAKKQSIFNAKILKK